VFALLVGVIAICYSVVDKLDAGLVHPVMYLAGLEAAASSFLAPLALLKYRKQAQEAWRHGKAHCVLVGLGSMGAYLLILWAFQQADASYVVAVRDIGNVVGAVLGVTILQEPLTVTSGLSVLAIVVGVVLAKAV
jgi:drug/metabolite transporter (DMT)-like permease